LKVVLLADRVKPREATAAVALGRLAYLVGTTLIVGAGSLAAMAVLPLTRVWFRVFRAFAIMSAVVAALTALVASSLAAVSAVGAAGGGAALAVARRLRGLFWAGLGLAIYPRRVRPSPSAQVSGNGRSREIPSSKYQIPTT
jgi:hypothetical protein